MKKSIQHRSQPSRRKFLQRGSTLAFGALAAPYIIPGSALGAEGAVAKRYRAQFVFDPEFDDRTGRILHGNSASSSRNTAEFLLNGNQITLVQETSSYQLPGGYAARGVALSADGRYFYYEGLQFLSSDILHVRQSFSQTIYAGASNYAFGSTDYYDATTGARVGRTRRAFGAG